MQEYMQVCMHNCMQGIICIFLLRSCSVFPVFFREAPLRTVEKWGQTIYEQLPEPLRRGGEEEVESFTSGIIK